LNVSETKPLFAGSPKPSIRWLARRRDGFRVRSTHPSVTGFEALGIIDGGDVSERHDRADARCRHQLLRLRIRARHRPHPLLETIERVQQHLMRRHK
jgi:hypothetical protein